MNDSVLHLFEGFGVELEYMIVDRETLSVFPAADQLIYSVAGSYESEIERGALCWSNELVLHVIELKTNGPVSSLEGLAGHFQTHVQEINRRLSDIGGCLMPTAMHPWMHPDTETRLWPHEYNQVYESFNRIFDCRGHGWSNLQSAHLNLPFSGDEEFGRLHAAIRLVLPLIPALTASSPLVECRYTGSLDNRMEYYRTNSRRIPSVTGHVIPEPAYTRRDYEDQILQPIYRDIAPYDPETVLQHEWLNARGAIARFDRNAIEIRVLDIQECPQADLAVHHAIVSVLRALIEERWSCWEDQRSADTRMLEAIFLDTIRDAESARITNADYLHRFGLNPQKALRAGELWREILEPSTSREKKNDQEFEDALRIILEQGPLSRRILKRLGNKPTQDAIANLYRELCDDLEHGRMLHA